MAEETTETQSVEQPKVEFYRTFATQEDFDNETAKIRGNAERKTKAELLKTVKLPSRVLTATLLKISLLKI